MMPVGEEAAKVLLQVVSAGMSGAGVLTAVEGGRVTRGAAAAGAGASHGHLGVHATHLREVEEGTLATRWDVLKSWMDSIFEPTWFMRCALGLCTWLLVDTTCLA